jgi:hypothetical protein
MALNTAVDWLIKEIINDQTAKRKSKHDWWIIFDQAKKMEKKQLTQAIEYGCSDWGSSKDAEKYYNEMYNEQYIDKAQWLRDNGWYTAWSEDNWLQRDEEYSNPDWAGMSTEHAYEYAMKYRKPSTIAEVEEWERRNNKNLG